jgi:hypothetical protein
MELQEGADRCTAGNASKLEVIPTGGEGGAFYRTGKLDPRIADTAVAAE